MRIRKNAKKLSPLLSSCVQGGSVPVESHVCQLNQSPWDVIPFHSDSIQFQPDDSFTAGNNNNNNGSAADSYFAVESVASLMDAEHATTTIVVDNDKSVAPNNFGATGMSNPCQGFDDSGKGWPCKNEASQGQAFCEHHLFNKKQTQPSSTGATHRRAKTRGAGKKAASSNPYEFYYYSGFGPSWGKRRGDRNGEESKNSGNSTMVESENTVGVAAGHEVVVDDDIINDNVVVVPSVMEMDSEVLIDYEDEDDDEDEVEENNGKKRMRKPVKARSLKSLM